jgi:hypothetical protein
VRQRELFPEPKGKYTEEVRRAAAEWFWLFRNTGDDVAYMLRQHRDFKKIPYRTIWGWAQLYKGESKEDMAKKPNAVRTTFVPARTKSFPKDARDYALRGEKFKALRQENLRRFKSTIQTA